jgi:hypothetical protein
MLIKRGAPGVSKRPFRAGIGYQSAPDQTVEDAITIAEG